MGTHTLVITPLCHRTTEPSGISGDSCSECLLHHHSSVVCCSELSVRVASLHLFRYEQARSKASSSLVLTSAKVTRGAERLHTD